MPRYLVERDFVEDFHVPNDTAGARACVAIAEVNRIEEVVWLHSYVSTNRKKTFCIYDAPSPEAIRRAATRNKLPLTRITEIRVLDPYFHL
ncbi:MAG TPA: DUF4242 domain-containing protein [Steroidobacteraceae bacterium]